MTTGICRFVICVMNVEIEAGVTYEWQDIRIALRPGNFVSSGVPAAEVLAALNWSVLRLIPIPLKTAPAGVRMRPEEMVKLAVTTGAVVAETTTGDDGGPLPTALKAMTWSCRSKTKPAR